MFCQFCGNTIEEGALFCHHCGGKVQEAPKKKKKKKTFLFVLIFILLSAGMFFAYRHFTKLSIQIDVAHLHYEEASDCYHLAKDFSVFEGTFTGAAPLIENVTYEIFDANNMVVSSGEVNTNESSWDIQKPGLMMGLNTLTISADMKLGKPITETFLIVNENPAFLDAASADIEDNDDDGLVNYYETVYKTDPSNADTDNDGLSDYIECVYTGTDPTLYSTEDDGICDADRDSDNDELSNIEEIKLSTDPGNPDNDGDGLPDGKEHSFYHTDPLDDDTDDDSASDGWEVEHNYDPLVSNKNFEVTQTSTAANSPVSAGVSLVCDGNPASVTIEPAAIDGLLDETMAGYLGSAYSFTYAGDFSSADISMTFDPSLLADNAEPAIYYYNEETQLLEELDTKIKDNVATTTVSHFSTYILLDRVQVSRVIEEDILSPDEIKNTTVNLAFVVDYSSSMDDNDPEYLRLRIVKEYLEKLRADKDSAALIKFAGYATTLVPLTSDKEMLLNATDSITNTGSDSCSYDDAGTNGSDGIKSALNELSTAEATKQYIIFLTDGEDTTTSYEYDDLIAEANSKNIVIYTIGMGECDEELLTKIADSTGGKFYYASAIDYDTDGSLSLEDAFAEIERETVDYYADSNEDGITDYYTRLICDGLLTTGTGANPFGEYTFDEIQSGNADLDGDKLTNGEEITVTESGDMIYMKYNSSPIDPDTDDDGHIDSDDTRPLLWDVGDRDLAIFSSLAYEDGSSFIGKMYTASQIKGTESEKGERHYFLDYASIDSSGIDSAISENWIIVDYVNQLSALDFFSATTFKCQNNIVISYRGTNEFFEWIDNFVGYGLINCHSEELYAKNYAKKIAAAYPNCKIYLTGHSLGGYLAQIATAELLEESIAIPVRVAYFNGIGMNFKDNTGIVELIKRYKMDKIDKLSKINEFFHLMDMLQLYEYASYFDLISYQINGDVVSSLGTHCGQTISYDVAAGSRQHHARSEEGTSFDEWLGTAATDIVSAVTARNLSYYYDYYEVKSILEYFDITHELDSFYYYLEQGTRSAKK